MGWNIWHLGVDLIIFVKTNFRMIFFREIRSVVFRGGGSHLIQMLLKVGQKGWHGNFNKGKVDGLTVNPIFIAITTDFSGRFTIWLKYFKSCSRHVQKWSVFRQNKSCFQLYFRKLYRNAELDRILRKVTWNTCTFQCY